MANAKSKLATISPVGNQYLIIQILFVHSNCINNNVILYVLSNYIETKTLHRKIDRQIDRQTDKETDSRFDDLAIWKGRLFGDEYR